jgi:hypothetical protein
VKLTKSEKTAPIDMLRTVSSSSSVSDIIATDIDGVCLSGFDGVWTRKND